MRPVSGIFFIASCLFTLGRMDATTITSVTFSGTTANPFITITGSGFLPVPATDGLASPGGTFSGYDYGRELYLYDITAGWDAGCGASVASGCHDFIGFANLTYTDTLITMTYGSEYQYYFPTTSWHLNSGDQYLLHVHQATFAGAVSFVPEPGTWVTLVSGILLLGARKIVRGKARN